MKNLETFSDAELTGRRRNATDERAKLINGHGNPCGCSRMCKRRAALDRVLDEVRAEQSRRTEATK